MKYKVGWFATKGPVHRAYTKLPNMTAWRSRKAASVVLGFAFMLIFGLLAQSNAATGMILFVSFVLSGIILGAYALLRQSIIRQRIAMVSLRADDLLPDELPTQRAALLLHKEGMSAPRNIHKYSAMCLVLKNDDILWSRT